MPNRLPIKVVLPAPQDRFRPSRGGGSSKHVEISAEQRRKLADQVEATIKDLHAGFVRFPDVPSVARVRIRKDAIAKTHRPLRLFNERSCPIIGATASNELLVGATPGGLLKVQRLLLEDDSKIARANISVLESISAFRASEPPAIAQPVGAMAKEPLKLILFNHHDSWKNHALRNAFERVCERNGGFAYTELNYGPSLHILRLDDYDDAFIGDLVQFPGTQHLGKFASYFPLRTASSLGKRATREVFPGPDPEVNYPIVGVVDSGVNLDDPLLRPWVWAQEPFVPKSRQVNYHGSFVSALIANARSLNHNDPRFPSAQAKILDVVALDRDGTSEDALIDVLDEVIPKYHEVVKIWNLSLGSEQPVADDAYSHLAAKLDSLQDEYGVTFVLAAGNHGQLRPWPASSASTADRICRPAESTRSIVVGSLAHIGTRATCVGEGHPSPFSRRGPGPNWLVKPDLCHFGGNCTPHGDSAQVGILSLSGSGQLAEDIGTSFAAPFVAVTASAVVHALTDGVSSNLLKALMVQSAVLRGQPITPESLPYFGFGVPGDFSDIVECRDSCATLVFEGEVTPHLGMQKLDFPMPSCLLNKAGRIGADITMTLVYDPPIDPTFGSEFCRRNLDVSLGTCVVDENGKVKKFKGEVPPEPAGMGKILERDLVKYGFKWSPVKVYRKAGKTSPSGNWRLAITCLDRVGMDNINPQRFALVVTIADPGGRAPVYDEVVVAMRNAGWAAQDLQLRNRPRAAS